MIVELLIDSVLELMQLIDGIVPSLTIPYEDEMIDGAQYMGGQLGMIDTAFPVAEMAEFFEWGLTLFVLPIVLPYTIGKFVYAHIPIAGRS